jgi:hypothetical protein
MEGFMLEMILSIVIGLLKAKYLIPAIVVTAFTIAGYFLFFNKKKIDLKNHTIFTNLAEHKYNMMTTVAETPKKRAFKKYISCYITHFEEWLKTYIANDKEWVTDDVTTSFNRMMSDLESCWIKDGAPLIFIEKWRCYNKESVDMLYRYISHATDSDYYDSDNDKKLLILTISQVIFFASLKDIDHIVASLNGELDEVFK